jgi:hypothetical protein
MRGRRKGTTPRAKRRVVPAQDLVKRKFAATETDRVWVADITYINIKTADKAFCIWPSSSRSTQEASSGGRWRVI